MPTDTPDDDAPQAEVTAFLRDPAAHAARPAAVEVIETHGALVFLAGQSALKIKRAVRLPYLDFSTLAAREHYCRREDAINRPNAPDIYLGVVAITRQADGHLAIGGDGQPVEWAVRMARFDQQQVLSTLADSHGIDDRLARQLADMVSAAHAVAPVAVVADAAHRLARIAGHVVQALRAGASAIDAGVVVGRIEAAIGRRLQHIGPLLDQRGAEGCVRRCHGDLHLGNIVLWHGRPTLFDALEFDEDLATIDTLYDLAFLLMDLDRRGLRRAANTVMNRYLGDRREGRDIEALAALPAMLGLRASIRAMVALDRARVQPATQRVATLAHAADTLSLALRLLQPPPPRLIAVGGLSGTGKTTLAAALAPDLLPVPGALHLRSDVIRKQLAGVDEQARLPADAYTPQASARVYAALLDTARRALSAGQSVVIDAVQARADERAGIEALARSAGVAFDGLWLEGDPDRLKARVAARTGDASDATPDVVERQLGYDTGTIDWHRIAASGPAEDVAAAARGALGLTCGAPD